MEQRIQQFHDDTKTIPTPPTARTLKQLNTLRKFIFKNQDYRFSDKEKNKLFACVEVYFTCFDRSATWTPESASAFPLIEDALKVPCFTTAQKSRLLKWYEEILAKQNQQPTREKAQTTELELEEENYDDFDWDAFEKE
ncbi:hypothetical protein BDF14DRAFT_1109811 [Spinellus fusiger]|nr:hypothetical protein BDF14DRAFT_1109811 [Spinellus fusiger]